MGDATVNGDLPKSLTLDHIKSYHFVEDSIDAFSKNPYGAKSIEITNVGYSKFVKPAFPYLQTPAAYASPYIQKADQIGDTILTKVDEKVPILKSETSEIKDTLLSYASYPTSKLGEGKDYLFSTYKGEYKKCGGDGYVAGGKAVITSSLVITSEFLTWLSGFMAEKKGKAEALIKEKASQAEALIKEKTSN